MFLFFNLAKQNETIKETGLLRVVVSEKNFNGEN